ncbi:MAG: hypothetical protein ACPL3P_03670 [Anaerolineales bacterium]
MEAYRREAVAVAVSVVLAQSQQEKALLRINPLPSSAMVSAWQAVLRSQVIKSQRISQ